MVKKMIFWGATGQAKVLRQCMINSGIELIGLFDNNYRLESPFKDVPIHYGREGFTNWIKAFQTIEDVGFLVAIGGDKGKDRISIMDYLESFNLIPLTAIHSTSFIDDRAIIGDGSQILANATLCVDVVIGRGCIINTSSSVDHDCELKDGVHVCPGAHLAGCVKVGKYSTIGTGATVLPRVQIGTNSIVGAGSVVNRNVTDNTVVVGNPARFLRNN